MFDENDLIEINLHPNLSTTNECKKLPKLFQSPKLSKLLSSYRQLQGTNDKGNDGSTNEKSNKSYTKSARDLRTSHNVSSIRQLYCPLCDQRLDFDSIACHKSMLCCFPVLPMSRVHQFFAQLTKQKPQVFCRKCGGSLGYMKSC